VPITHYNQHSTRANETHESHKEIRGNEMTQIRPHISYKSIRSGIDVEINSATVKVQATFDDLHAIIEDFLASAEDQMGVAV
jgi:hypothetical protein